MKSYRQIIFQIQVQFTLQFNIFNYSGYSGAENIFKILKLFILSQARIFFRYPFTSLTAMYPPVGPTQPSRDHSTYGRWIILHG